MWDSVSTRCRLHAVNITTRPLPQLFILAIPWAPYFLPLRAVDKDDGGINSHHDTGHWGSYQQPAYAVESLSLEGHMVHNWAHTLAQRCSHDVIFS